MMDRPAGRKLSEEPSEAGPKLRLRLGLRLKDLKFVGLPFQSVDDCLALFCLAFHAENVGDGGTGDGIVDEVGQLDHVTALFTHTAQHTRGVYYTRHVHRYWREREGDALRRLWAAGRKVCVRSKA